jgi:glc operon protein GlcG
MRIKTTLGAEEAANIITAAKAEAMVKGWNVSIAVVDDAGMLIHLERMDGAGAQSPEVATLKARTSALSGAPTKALEDVVKDRPAVALFPGRLPVQGGVPVIVDGQCVGGVGVSGVKSHEDEVVALAGAKAVVAA